MNMTNVSQSLRLREYYYMLLRRKWWFIITVCISMIVALTLAFTLPKIYRAEAVLLIEDEKILNPLISGLAISPSVTSRLRTLREELLSWQRLTLLAEKLKMDKDIKNPLEYERMIKNLRSKIKIQLRGSLIIITHEGPSPAESQKLVQTLSDIIMQGSIISVNLEANSAIRFINEQLADYESKLQNSEDELRKFKEIYNRTLPVATRMNEQLVQLKIELSNLLVSNTEAHPRVIQTRQLIDEIENQRDVFMQKSKEDGVDINEEDFGKMVSSIPLQQQKLAQLQRNYAVNDSMYQKLLQRLETAKLSQTLEQSDNGTKFRSIEPARLPLEPVKPNKILYLLGGLFLGIGLGVLLVYVIELSNNSIRNVEEAGHLLEYPIFGSIATIRPEELLMSERLRAETASV